MKIGQKVLKESDNGNILQQGVVMEVDEQSHMVRVEWEFMPGFHIWEEISDVEPRDIVWNPQNVLYIF